MGVGHWCTKMSCANEQIACSAIVVSVNFWENMVKTVHMCVAFLFVVAVVFAVMAQFKAAVGICLLSTLIEIIASALLGKKQNM